MTSHLQGIDLKYRPGSYFWASEHGVRLVSDIKGAARRILYGHALDAGLTELMPLELQQHSLTSEQRSAQGRIHPALLGGEYLPDYRSKEVEIARITIASTTQDVTCVYARPVGRRIHYRVVDEYGGGTLGGPRQRTSVKPLTLEQLVDFFLKSWDLITCLDANYADEGHPRGRIHAFIVDASSSFYADFEDLIRARVDDWLDSLQQPEVEESSRA